MTFQRFLLIITILVIILVLGACKINGEKANEGTQSTPSDSELQDYNKGWYNKIITGFEQDEIQKSAASSNAVAEYRVVRNNSRQGYDYYALQVFDNGIGKFTYMVYKSENFKTGELLLNKTKSIDVSETKKLLTSISTYDFWGIPAISHDNQNGTDGFTIFIEGFKDGKTHFATMWSPDNKYNIYKIYNEFFNFGESIAKKPVIRFD